MHYQLLHEKALQSAKEYKKSESQLLEVLIEINKERVYLKIGYPSLHVYCTEALGLTDSQAYTFCGVAKKSIEVPELKAAIDKGELNLSNARKVVPIINQENKALWVEKASELSQRELDREIKSVFPERIIKESLRPVTETNSELKVVISVELEKKLKRVKDLLSQSKRKPVSLEEALEEISEAYIQRKDPVVKAQRVTLRKSALVSIPKLEEKKEPERKPPVQKVKSAREDIPASLKHLVNMKYQGRCAHVYPHGARCCQERWVEIHHKVPVSLGGKNEPENLILLCSGHHKSVHVK